MADNLIVTGIACPRRCGAFLRPQSSETVCPNCRWNGEVHLFQPLALRVERSEAAMPDDATCVHHPAKRAVATCAGTGDYICALCSIPVDGETYSAQYLNAGGKKKAGEVFDRYLPRPDSEIVTVLALTFLFSCLGLIFLPYAVYRFFDVLKLRRTNPLYARVVGTGRVVGVGIVISVLGLAFVGVIIAIAVSTTRVHP